MSAFAKKLKGFFPGRETATYILIGFISTVVGWLETFIYNNIFHWGYWTANFVVFGIGVFFTFFANRRFTFQSDRPIREQLPRFLVNVAVCFAVSYGATRWLLGQFFATVWAPPVSVHMLDTLTSIAANCVYIVLNYLGQKLFVFRKADKPLPDKD